MMETKRHRGGPPPGYDINREAEIANELRRREEQERSDLSRQLLMEVVKQCDQNINEYLVESIQKLVILFARRPTTRP